MGKKDTDKGGVRMDRVIIRCSLNLSPDMLEFYREHIRKEWDKGGPLILPPCFEISAIERDGKLFLIKDGELLEV